MTGSLTMVRVGQIMGALGIGAGSPVVESLGQFCRVTLMNCIRGGVRSVSCGQANGFGRSSLSFCGGGSLGFVGCGATREVLHIVLDEGKLIGAPASLDRRIPSRDRRRAG